MHFDVVCGRRDDGAVLRLLPRGLVEECGRRETLGRPIEYRTTDKFLMHFGIESLSELPDLNELEPLRPEAGETNARGPFA